MRMLAYNTHSKIIDFTQYHEFYIVDMIDELDDAMYYLKMRFYNLVLIYENNLKNCLKLLKIAPKNNTTALVVITDNLSIQFELECLKNGALDVMKTPLDHEVILARLEAIHRKKFQYFITIGNEFILDMEFKEVFDINNNTIDIKGKAFDILNYLVQYAHRRVSKEELAQAIWKEPELVRNNLIEVHISVLKGELKKHFAREFIDNIKRKGYRFLEVS